MLSRIGTAGGRQRTRTVKIAFRASTTITPDPSWLECYGVVVGAGEGGQAGGQTYSNASGDAGRGGNGGGYAEGPVAFTLGVPLAIMVGLGGNGGLGSLYAGNGAPPTPNLGAAGGTSSIGAVLSATGGSNAAPGQGYGGLITRKGGLGGLGAASTNNGNAQYASPGAGGGSAGSPFSNGYAGGAAFASGTYATAYPGTGGGTGGPGSAGGYSPRPAGRTAYSGTPIISSPTDLLDPRFAYSAVLPTSALAQPGWGGGYGASTTTAHEAGLYGGGLGGTQSAYTGEAGYPAGLGGGGGGGAGQGNVNTNTIGPNGGKGGDGLVILEITLAAA